MSFDFEHPELLVAQANARTIAALVAAAADLTLVVDGGDVIRDLSHNLDAASGDGIPAWRGQHIDEVVRNSSRPTLRKALKLARSGHRAERFDVSHLLLDGRDLPVQYAAHGIGGDGGIMLMGRDLRLVSELQSRLMANRQSLDQNARTRKQAEAHYRLLFETAADAIVIVDAASGKVRDANPRAAALLGVGQAGASGRKFTSLFDRKQQADVQALLSGVLASGKATAIEVGGDTPLALAADLFRAGDLKLIMVRLSSPDADAGVSASGKGLETLVRSASEAVVLTDLGGKILWANESFLALADIPLAAHALGRRLADFLQWSVVEQDRLLETVRKHGRMPAFPGAVKGASAQVTDVELSVVAMADAASPGYGFVMRVNTAENARVGAGNSDLARAAESLVEMVGSVPMKDLVRDTTDVIERMCIEAALKLTGDNRASAARVLGLSRQALYLKMNRFGIADGE